MWVITLEECEEWNLQSFGVHVLMAPWQSPFRFPSNEHCTVDCAYEHCLTKSHVVHSWLRMPGGGVLHLESTVESAAGESRLLKLNQKYNETLQTQGLSYEQSRV